MRKKRRISIIIQIVFLFLIATIVSIGAIILFGRIYLMQRAVEVNMDTARGTTNLIRHYLEPLTPLDGMTEEHKVQTKVLFREFCLNFHFKYVYVYRAYPDGAIEYYIVASEDDQMNEEIQRDRPFGTVVKRELFASEKKILDGEEDAYEFVDNYYGNVCMFLFPLKDKDGNVCGIIGIDSDISSVHIELLKELQSMLFMVMVYMLIAISLSLLLIKSVVLLPIDNLSKKMRKFAEDRTVELPDKQFRISNEVTDMYESFGKMAGDISDYVRDLRGLTTEIAKAETQIEVARKIQRDIIPPGFNVIGNGYNVFCFEKSAKAVGGDFYDVFYLNEQELCVTVGDISGKGISAALFMVMVKTNLRNYAKSGASPAEVLKVVNREICQSNSQGMFATIFLSVLNTETGVLRYANGGHEKPLYLCDEPYYLNPDSGMALGLFEDAEFVDEECKLEDGQGILIYTDGVVESINLKKEQYGKDRLKETAEQTDVSGECGRESEVLVKHIIDSVESYSRDMEQFDDITCVSLVYRNNEESRWKFKPEIASFDRVREKMIEVLGNTEKSRNMIMACEEMFSNIVNYSGTESISVVFWKAYDTFSVELIDNGKPFDPINAVIRNKDFLELDTGGMGIKLARLNSREMIYNRIKGRNHLLLKFDVAE